MENEKIIERFYRAFADGDVEKMIECYHERIEFADPAFGTLKGADAKNMWRMLIENGKGNIKINFENVRADGEKGSADWTARYVFSRTGRDVFNRIHAEFDFEDGKIIRHIDRFDVWKWSRQALGLPGLLLGWSPFLKNKIRRNAIHALETYSANLAQKPPQ